MRTIRTEMRSPDSSELSVPQFRSMMFIHIHPHTSLSEVAENIGFTLPSTSKLIDSLVEREFLLREPHATDRRRMALDLTPAGSAMLARAHAKMQRALSHVLHTLSDSDRSTIFDAMEVLRPAFDTVQTKSNSLHPHEAPE